MVMLLRVEVHPGLLLVGVNFGYSHHTAAQGSGGGLDEYHRGAADLWLRGVMDSLNSSHPLRFQPLGTFSLLDALDPCVHVFVSRVQRDTELVEHSDAWRKADIRESESVTYQELLAGQMFVHASKCLWDLPPH